MELDRYILLVELAQQLDRRGIDLVDLLRREVDEVTQRGPRAHERHEHPDREHEDRRDQELAEGEQTREPHATLLEVTLSVVKNRKNAMPPR